MFDGIATASTWLQSWLNPEVGLWGLFLSAFLSATVLPGSSELVLTALITAYPALAWPAFWVAWGGNVLGCMPTYGMGVAGRSGYARFRGVQHRVDFEHRHLKRLRRHGPPALFLAFLPVVGDALVLGAGWLRLPFWPSMAWIAVGKAARYALLLLSIKGLLSLV